MKNTYEQRFYSALKDSFIGEQINGESGYVNLMSLKAKYFEEIRPYIEEKVNGTIEPNYREELFEKLYNFFDCYLNETGTVFFANTQIHKNLYEKVYSDRDDVSLFWKTQKLYYVKSEVNFQDLDIAVNQIKIKFDASEMKNTKGNEKKSLKFFLIKVNSNELVFKVRYAENNDYKKIKEYLKFDYDDIDKSKITNNQILDKLNSEYGQDIHANIEFIDTAIERNVFTNLTDNRKCLYIENCYDLFEKVKVEYSISDIELIMKHLISKNIFVSQDELIKTFNTYKRQNEIDYFIHKDAEGFLKEQFDIYIYNWLFNDLNTDFDVATVKRIQNLKKIAHNVIKYIAKFEDELKAIWEKPKFVRKCDYVVTLDKLSENDSLISEIMDSPGWKQQVKEWELFKFEYKCYFETNNTDYTRCYLPIDTKYFKEIKYKILNSIKNIDKTIDGVLIKTDNWQGLNTLQIKLKDKVDLIYIDPPFNTGSDFVYKDRYQDSTWLTLLENRLQYSNCFLKESGNFYLHLDRNAQHLGKLVLDNTFGHNNFINEIIWRMGWVSGYKTQVDAFVRNHDTIFFYCRNKKQSYFDKVHSNIPYTTLPYQDYKVFIDNIISKANINVENIRSLNLNIIASNKEVIRLYPSNKLKKQGKYHIEDTWNSNVYEAIDSNKIKRNVAEYTPNGSEITQKPEELLERIINLSSPKKGIVLDYFSGSGTTLAVAHKLERKWVGMELNKYFDSDVLWRMKSVLNGRKVGISKMRDVKKGGFFKYYELEQYEDVLAKAKYKYLKSDKNNTNHIESYSFMQDEKLLDAIEIDYENSNAKVMFENLYPDVDIAETLSNLSGKHIKKLLEDRVIFEDNTEIIYDEMTFEKYPWIKPLIWWNSKK